MNTDSTLTTRQAARALDVTVQAISFAVRSGRIKATRTPLGHFRIEARDLIEFASNRRRRTTYAS